MNATVIIPSHNEGDLLPSTIAEVLKHSPGAEVVVVDDHSDDGSGDDARQEYRANSRVSVLQPPERLGAVGARNLGTAKATGEYLVFIDAHTELAKDWLPRLLGPFKARAGVGVTTSAMIPMGEDDPELRAQGARIADATLEWEYPPPRPTRNPYPVMVAPLGCFAVHTETFRSLGGLDAGLVPPWSNEDTDMSFRYWAEGYEVLVVPTVEVRTLYRDAFPYPGVTEENRVYNTLRIALKYLARRDIEKVIDAHRDHNDLPAALMRIIASDTYTVRREIAERCKRANSWLLARFGVSL